MHVFVNFSPFFLVPRVKCVNCLYLISNENWLDYLFLVRTILVLFDFDPLETWNYNKSQIKKGKKRMEQKDEKAMFFSVT